MGFVTEIQERLAELLAHEKAAWKSFERLAQKIHLANHEADGLKVDRRKLRRIVDKEPVSLSFLELQALDTYFTVKGTHGFHEVFDKPTLIRSLAASQRLLFLIGAKPQAESKTVALSRWDVRSMISVIHNVHRVSTSVILDIQDVLLGTPENGRKQRLVDSEVTKQLGDRSGRSVVCIGSPRACHASEMLLAKMFEIPPFERAPHSPGHPLPFHFVWSDDQYDELPSSFALRASDVLKNGAAAEGWKSVAIKLTDPDKVYAVDRSKRGWMNYGVVVAQRRETGQIWIVVAGLSGPSTLAAAEMLVSVGAQLLLEDMPGKSPVIWALVESAVRRDRRRQAPGEDRALVGERVLVGPRKWPVETR